MDCIFSNAFKNSSRSNKGNHNHGHHGVWILDLMISILDFSNFISLFSPYILVLIEKIYQTFETGFTTFSNNSKFMKNSLLCILFSTSLMLFGNAVKSILEKQPNPLTSNYRNILAILDRHFPPLENTLGTEATVWKRVKGLS